MRSEPIGQGVKELPELALWSVFGYNLHTRLSLHFNTLTVLSMIYFSVSVWPLKLQTHGITSGY